MGDADYLHAFQKIVMPIAMEFAPELVMSKQSFDPRWENSHTTLDRIIQFQQASTLQRETNWANAMSLLLDMPI